jgi:hypothetical protein
VGLIEGRVGHLASAIGRVGTEGRARTICLAWVMVVGGAGVGLADLNDLAQASLMWAASEHGGPAFTSPAPK